MVIVKRPQYTSQKVTIDKNDYRFKILDCIKFWKKSILSQFMPSSLLLKFQTHFQCKIVLKILKIKLSLRIEQSTMWSYIYLTLLNSNILVSNSRLVLVSDSYISDLTQRVFRSNIDGCHGVALRLLTKKSVAAGIRKAYQQYKQRKFQSIQELSARIVQLIHPDDEPLPAPLNPVSRVSDVDEHASEVTDTFLVMSRSV